MVQLPLNCRRGASIVEISTTAIGLFHYLLQVLQFCPSSTAGGCCGEGDHKEQLDNGLASLRKDQGITSMHRLTHKQGQNDIPRCQQSTSGSGSERLPVRGLASDSVMEACASGLLSKSAYITAAQWMMHSCWTIQIFLLDFCPALVLGTFPLPNRLLAPTFKIVI